MATSSLSAYWANFFKAAGFTSEVAMKHALVFSNNRIKPDMLSELDKPSLKEMGITLMGDMIAILRYAKKVVEERSCEKFLVDTEQPSKVVKKVPKVIKKKVVAKVIPKPTTSSLKADSTTTKKIVQSAPVIKGKKIIVKKSMLSEGAITTETPLKRPRSVLKRKAEELEDEEDQNDQDQDEEATTNIQPSIAKKVRTVSTTQRKVGYAVTLPTGLTQQRTDLTIKKSQEPKQTVFDRLGNECTDAPNNVNESPTKFTVTGLGKGIDVYKRSPSVFNRLGDKDSTRSNLPSVGVIRNGDGGTMSGGILKTQIPVSRTCLITTKQISPRPGGTMRADEEQKRIKLSSIAKPIKKNINKIVYNNNPNGERKLPRNSSLGSGKLASEQPATIPAKARLGVARPSSSLNKQVTFSKVTTVNHYRKPYNADVFSRLGY